LTARARTVVSHSEEETAAAGRELAPRLDEGAIVLLFGDLGAGKTAFTRGLAEGLGIVPDEVSSPTFTIIQEYRGGRLPLFHVDLYRLNDPREIEELGLDEVGQAGVLSVEWAEKLPRAQPAAIQVHIEHGEGDERLISVTSP
jgi:tRNA threonylcarbamoyladenosine biosynthesis protein TsaE